MQTQLIPLLDRVIVLPKAKEDLKKSGIIIPENVNQEKPEQGEVIAVGPGRRLNDGTLVEVGVKVGDIVVFRKYAPDEIEIEKQNHLILAESDILAILKQL